MATTMRMEPRGPAGKGLEDWGGVDPAELVSGTPQQHGHMYLDDAARGLTAGVWDCTAMHTKMGPYSVDEFMVLLEGSVTILHQDGSQLTVNAGESFVIPKGTVCSWTQAGYVRKFFVIFTDPAKTPVTDGARLRAFKVDPGVALAKADGPDPALVISGTPEWADKLLYQDVTGQFLVGVWSTTPYARKVIEFPRHELMHILDGEVTITDAVGGGQSFAAGETLLVPKGTMMGWKNDAPVRKIYCIFLPKTVAKAEAAE
jgi:uncharacterized cupin superfamily protein